MVDTPALKVGVRIERVGSNPTGGTPGITPGNHHPQQYPRVIVNAEPNGLEALTLCPGVSIRWGTSANGNTPVLQAGVRGSIPLSSTVVVTGRPRPAARKGEEQQGLPVQLRPTTIQPIKEEPLEEYEHRHHHEDHPLREVLEALLRDQRELVANTAALTAAVADNEAAVAANTTAVEAAVAAITSDADQAAVDAATSAVQTNTEQVEANTASLNDAVTPPVAPTVTGVSPTSGPAAGGTAVTVTGTAFTGATAVTFDTAEATSVIVVSDTEVTADVPAGTDGTSVNVYVTTPNGTSPASATFNYAPSSE